MAGREGRPHVQNLGSNTCDGDLEFDKWNIQELKLFLSNREVPSSDKNKHELIRLCKKAQLLSLPKGSGISDPGHTRYIEQKLILDGGLIRLPNPSSSSLAAGWESDGSGLPDLLQVGVENYFERKNKDMNIKTAGKEALRDGKSLHLSGHVCNLQVHGVHVDSPYCFIRCKAVRETSVSLPPYDTWIIVHKRRNIIVDGYCSCPGGIQGTCKHIAALCHTVIETVARGDNKAVTEKVQAWHAPSKKPHKPDFVKDITIRKVKGDCGLEEDSNHTKRTRYNNDPRAVEDRQDKTLQDLDLEGLRVATNGSAGILAYVQFGSNESEMPDVEHVVNEEVVTNAEYICMPDLPKTLPEIAQEASSTQELFQLATTPVSEEVVNIIRETTKDQTQSDSWFKYRQGRITASNLYEAVRKVRSDETVSEQNTSFLKKVMDYGPRPYAPAIYWGQYNEKSAVDKFVKLNRRHHKKLRADACGTVLCAEYPFLSASPDAVITCTCCGVRPLEVKNPYTNRHLSINKFAELPDTCLDITSTGKKRLNACHSYYYQVQAQLLCLQADSGYFALQTACAYNNFHWEEI
ncbi:uncharacterized protein LOC118411675 [Branchiostoma floridae]|uniref:Uncharacterized protein LOC118411675 n=1 Tax=Branchiostoma floridae TaxID=7739 RepID=A0A9J7KUG4_BRAFL|nr:uncharacterized protein LOC118411675 [Branchiostoma floridae]